MWQEYLITLSLIIGIVAILQDVALYIFLYRNEASSNELKADELPKVSVLVAARDEEVHIKELLHYLLRQSYPAYKIEIWVGDDGSSDATAQLAQSIAADYDRVFYHKVDDTDKRSQGKARALHQLTELAKGELFLITDADMRPPKEWVEAMVSAASGEGVGLVTGFTAVKTDGFLSILQHLDWVYAQALLQGLSSVGIHAASMGNNMAVWRKAYEAVGGYPNIPFSVTEDFALFKAIKAADFQCPVVANPQAKSFTHPMQNYSSLVAQRSRWMAGAVKLHTPITPIFYLQGASIFAIPILFAFSPIYGGMLFFGKAFVQMLLIQLQRKKMQLSNLPFSAIIYSLHLSFISLAMLFKYLWSSKITWKGRQFSK
ncbi:MAG: glycosyltransferase [Cyclobacteriaceae bacterium]|nr:glycosyltransferase [Cyclobacteriaceae bacterium]MCH8516679.1 glycosyltransferase [Cyclobacteriaceae bacterium]